jgi:hypothetical protein
LNAAIIDIQQVFEDEHLVFNFLCQLGVVTAYVFHHFSFQRAAHEIQNLCGSSYATLQILFPGAAASHELAQHVIEFAQRNRLHSIQRGDAQQHIIAGALGKHFKNIGRLIRFQVNQNGRDDLRMLIADHFGYRARIHPFQAFDPAGIAVVHDAIQQTLSLVVPQRLGEHVADVIVGIHPDGGFA